MRGGCPKPIVNPSLHVRSPNSNASNNVGAFEVATAVISSVGVLVIIATLLVKVDLGEA